MTGTRSGGCNCGRVRFEARGDPVRVGLCHCHVCRRETGSLGNFFAVWRAADVTLTGETGRWRLQTDERHFCPACGSSVFALDDRVDEVELRVGAFDDAPSGLVPAYELWTGRREEWLAAVPAAAQHASNRT